MSRSNYSDDLDNWALICWRGAVKKAITGKRGQLALKELLTALDAMPNKRLIAQALDEDGEQCTLGVLGKVRALPMETVDPGEPEEAAKLFGLAPALVREIAYENDEGSWDHWNSKETPEQRWARMRRWVEDQIIKVAS